MKKIFIAVLFLCCAQCLYSQDNLGSLRVGHELLVSSNGGGINNYFGGGINYQRAVTDKATIGANIDYLSGANSYFMFNLEPRFDYFIDKAFKGFHLGTHVAYNISGLSGGFNASKTIVSGLVNPSSNGFNLGANVGYMIKLGDVRIDLAVSPSFWYNITNSGDHAVTVKSMATIGYVF